MTDYAAIDFETANEQPYSVCSVGVVIVRGGEVVDTILLTITTPWPMQKRAQQ